MFSCDEEYTIHCNAMAQADIEAAEAEYKEMLDKKILECAKELIKAIKESGRDMAFKRGLTGEVVIPISLNVHVFDTDNSGLQLWVDNINNDWKVIGDYTE